jgi:voltage-gated potassium channel
MDERSLMVEKRLEVPMLLAAALVLPLLVIEQEAHTDLWRNIAVLGNWIVWLAFAAEAIIMLAVVTRRWHWIKRHPLECIVVLCTAPILPASFQAFRALRLTRLLRLAILARRARQVFTAHGLAYAAILSVIAVLGGGAAFRIAEANQDLTYGTSIWWALTTATTVGYGDVFPETDAGRFIAAGVMVVGIGFVALLTAAMARQFLEPATDAIEADDREVLRLLQDISARLERIEATREMDRIER